MPWRKKKRKEKKKKKVTPRALHSRAKKKFMIVFLLNLISI